MSLGQHHKDTKKRKQMSARDICKEVSVSYCFPWMLRACLCVFSSARFRNSERSVRWKHNASHTQKCKVSNSHFDIKVTYRERETGEINFDNIFYVSTIPKILSFQPVIHVVIIELFYILFFFGLRLWNLGMFYTCGTPQFRPAAFCVLSCRMWLVAAILDSEALRNPRIFIIAGIYCTTTITCIKSFNPHSDPPK